jgi:replicative DNA helicase
MRKTVDRQQSSGRPRVVSVPIPSLPTCIESEKRVLGAILIDASVADIFFGSLDATDFFSTARMKIFEALEDLCREKKSFDLLTARSIFLPYRS